MIPDGQQGPPRRLLLLGSTGSIGRSTLDVLRLYPGLFEVAGLAAHSNAGLLIQQAREFRVRRLAMTDRAAAQRVRDALPEAEVLEGPEGLAELAAQPADIALFAIVGAAGLKPLLCALDAGTDLAVANKEPLVMAGRLVMARARKRGVRVLPVDSEHSAIFQCLMGHEKEDVHCIHLTASGGPFYRTDPALLARITPEEATVHPTWVMGAKISVDSATLMNKGLEIVEAMWLFDLPPDNIEVVIHPQSIVHSLVEFRDGHMLAHLGVTDMKFPILFALCYPNRVKSPIKRLDLTQLKELSFAAPDFTRFPCLAYAREAAMAGGTAPAILNAANEVAVEAFCKHRIGFLDISEVVRRTREQCPPRPDLDIETIVEDDARARAAALNIVQKNRN